MHGFGHAAGYGANFGGFGDDRPEVINNYDGDSSERSHDSQLSPDIEDRRGESRFSQAVDDNDHGDGFMDNPNQDDNSDNLADDSSSDDSSDFSDSFDSGGGDDNSGF